MSDTVGFMKKCPFIKFKFFAKFHNIPNEIIDDLLKKLDLFRDKRKKSRKFINRDETENASDQSYITHT